MRAPQVLQAVQRGQRVQQAATLARGDRGLAQRGGHRLGAAQRAHERLPQRQQRLLQLVAPARACA